MAVSVVPLADVDPIPLPGDSWSRMLVTGDRVPGTASSIGYSVFTPGTVLAPGSGMGSTSASGTTETAIRAPTPRP